MLINAPRPLPVGLLFRALLVLPLVAHPVGAQNVTEPDAGVDNGERAVSLDLDLRYRYEWVDQDGFDKQAKASLLRSRVTLSSTEHRGFSALLEIDDVSSIGADDYNSTENGETAYPTIADPQDTEVNQALLRFTRDDLSVTAGRQRILLGNARFIGAKPWRNNEQTYDGLRLQWNASPSLSIDASYVNQVNRVFGPGDGANPGDWHGDSGFLRTSYRPAEGRELIAFAYLLDVNAQSDFAPGKTVNNASDTFGLEYRWNVSAATLRASVATQRDAGRSELNYSAYYYVVEAGVPLGGLQFRAGYEVLGADNDVGFATPLANGHGYQGWVDKFLSTPGDGLADAWLSMQGKLGPLALTARYHDFRSEESSVDFGHEVDLQAQWVLNDRLTVTAKAAFFDSSAPERYDDTTKAWLMLQFKL